MLINLTKCARSTPPANRILLRQQMLPLLKTCHVAGAFPPFEAQMITSYKNANGIIMGKYFLFAHRPTSAALRTIVMKTFHKPLTDTLHP